MEQRPSRKRLARPAPPGDPSAPPIKADTLAERMEQTRLQVEALEREVVAMIAERRTHPG